MPSALAPPDRQAFAPAGAPASPHPDEASAAQVLVVGYDGSTRSRAAIAEAARRHDPRGRLIIVRALAAELGKRRTRAARHAYQRAVTSLLAAVRSELHPRVPYELRVVAGDESAALAEVVRRHHGAELVSGDPVHQSGLDSFPASDPPSWWRGSTL